MDNITHSLFGATVSESLWNLLPANTQDRLGPATRKKMLLTSVLANNFPDIDVFFSRYLHSSPQLGNLLHHRGHTHTLLLALLQGLLLFGILNRKSLSRGWRWILFLALSGTCTHILLDGLNNYGVHPFWPMDSSWKYLDWVFILEPWFWVTFSLFLFSVSVTKKAKTVYLIIPVLGFILSWALGVVPLMMNLTFSIWAVLLGLLLWKLSPRNRAVSVWIATLSILFCFELGYRTTHQIITTDLKAKSDFEIEEISLSPLPVNPFCWAVVSIETNATDYRLKRAITAPFPKLVSLHTCTSLKFFGPEVQTQSAEDHTLWDKEHSFSLLELKSLWDQYCDVRDFLRFSRAPYFWKENDSIYFSDLRFERRNQRSFARIQISQKAPPCSPSAPWVEPLKKVRLFEQETAPF